MITIDKIRRENGEFYAILSYEPRKNYLLMKWIGICSDEEVKNASHRMLEWQKENGRKTGCKFHIHETKEIEGAWVGTIDWNHHEFFPMNHQFGLRYNISILSPDLFSKWSSKAL